MTLEQDKITTIQLHQSIKDELGKHRHGGETYEDVIRRFLLGEIDIFVDVKSVDGKPAHQHRVVLQVGNKWFVYEYGKIKSFLRRTSGI